MTRETAFKEFIGAGGKVDANGWMPDDYRQIVLRTVAFQAVAEVTGCYVFREFMLNAPSLAAQLLMTAKIQDEIGHAHVMFRVCEDLGWDREAIMDDYFAGRIKALTFFQYKPENWLHFTIATTIGTPAPIIQFKSLANGSYEPYNRALRKLAKEEAFHFRRSYDVTRTILNSGRPLQKRRIQEGLAIWWPRTLLHYFGPQDADAPVTVREAYGIKVDRNDELRQRWLDRVVPMCEELGLRIPDPNLRRHPETGRWAYTEPAWDELKRVTYDGSDYGRGVQQGVEKEFRRHQALRASFAERDGSFAPAGIVGSQETTGTPKTDANKLTTLRIADAKLLGASR